MEDVEMILEKFKAAQNTAATINGLMIAQIICQRRFFDAFDGANGATLVSSIMQDISDTIEVLNKEQQ